MGDTGIERFDIHSNLSDGTILPKNISNAIKVTRIGCKGSRVGTCKGEGIGELNVKRGYHTCLHLIYQMVDSWHISEY